ncbi:carbohydrate porin [Piscinibacter sp. XHJ-5]|uniref:maltoporin n=1 Tax=Piscinibacter sp. XHJ-5 TaxID=3037797 RepID=UPI002452E200|nr:carbohydrate porin [Piscinibacter sp. XHJ-5]
MRRHTRATLTLATLASAAATLCTPASAVDWGGYLRAGPGATKKDAARACYGLSGPGLKYRLGNECDIYGEFILSQGFQKDGVDYKASLMTNLHNPGTDTGDSKVGINQMFVEGKGFDIAPDSTFWIGKRFYGRADVHIVDTFYVNMSGVGAGVDGIAVGPGKLNLAYFRTDGDATHPGSRLNADLKDIAVNPGGKLRVTGTLTHGDFTGGKSGAGLSLQHEQDNVLGLGGANTLWLQVASGSAGLDANFGSDLGAASGTRAFRIVESLTWQVGALGGQAQALWQTDKDGATGLKTDSSTVGGRMSYAMSKHLKLLLEAGYSQKKPDNGATQKLAKLTFGPALSTGPGFWNRPELRLYVTTAKWNDAANAAAGPGGVTGIGDGKTRGTSYGAQVEMWF